MFDLENLPQPLRYATNVSFAVLKRLPDKIFKTYIQQILFQKTPKQFFSCSVAKLGEIFNCFLDCHLGWEGNYVENETLVT